MIPHLILNLWLRAIALFVSLPDLDGGSGGPDQGGGGTPGTPTGSSQSLGIPFGEVGGVFGSTYYLFIPVQNIITNACFIGMFDVGSFDDQVDGGFYTYKVEDINQDRMPTVNRVVLTYRDLGPATIFFTVTGVDDNDSKVSANSAQTSIGTAAASQLLLTKFIDLSISCFRPQLSFTRVSGPVSVVAVTMRGTVELIA
jgi:hypothetical protein